MKISLDDVFDTMHGTVKPKQPTAEEQAAAYARSTTNTRCHAMGRCEGCKVRYCDYRSRYAAFLAGWATGFRESSLRRL